MKYLFLKGNKCMVNKIKRYENVYHEDKPGLAYIAKCNIKTTRVLNLKHSILKRLLNEYSIAQKLAI